MTATPIFWQITIFSFFLKAFLKLKFLAFKTISEFTTGEYKKMVIIGSSKRHNQNNIETTMVKSASSFLSIITMVHVVTISVEKVACLKKNLQLDTVLGTMTSDIMIRDYHRIFINEKIDHKHYSTVSVCSLAHTHFCQAGNFYTNLLLLFRYKYFQPDNTITNFRLWLCA